MGKSRFSELRQDLEDGRARLPGGVVVRKRAISIPCENYMIYFFKFSTNFFLRAKSPVENRKIHQNPYMYPISNLIREIPGNTDLRGYAKR